MIARFSLVALDCLDPVALAEFYQSITGWSLESSEDEEWVQLRSPNGPTLAFQLSADHEPPDWPSGDSAQQLHLDFDVDDLDIAESQVLAIGGRKVDHQPEPQIWRVFIDPAGHPFCFVLDKEFRKKPR